MTTFLLGSLLIVSADTATSQEFIPMTVEQVKAIGNLDISITPLADGEYRADLKVGGHFDDLGRQWSHFQLKQVSRPRSHSIHSVVSHYMKAREQKRIEKNWQMVGKFYTQAVGEDQNNFAIEMNDALNRLSELNDRQVQISFHFDEVSEKWNVSVIIFGDFTEKGASVSFENNEFRAALKGSLELAVSESKKASNEAANKKMSLQLIESIEPSRCESI